MQKVLRSTGECKLCDLPDLLLLHCLHMPASGGKIEAEKSNGLLKVGIYILR